MSHPGGVTTTELRAPGRGRPAALGGGAFIAGVPLVAIGVGIGVGHLAKSGLGVVALLGLAALLVGLVSTARGVVGLLRVVPGWWRLICAVTLLVVAALVVYVLAVPLRASLPPRAAAPATPPGIASARTVTVPTEDGERLAAWWVPSTSGAAVVLLPGSGSSSASLARHVEVLADGGFGVLALDPRGHGRSSGRAMDWGWYGDVDVPAAVSQVIEQAGVDPERIAVVGLSMGGEQAIGAAGVDPRIRAVVAEGVTGRSAADLRWLADAYGWRGSFTIVVHQVQTAVADLLSPASPPPPLRQAVAAASPRPVLLVVAGERPDEEHAAEDLQSAAPGSVELWVVPGAVHTAGLGTDPAGWSERVLRFLDEALR